MDGTEEREDDGSVGDLHVLKRVQRVECGSDIDRLVACASSALDLISLMYEERRTVRSERSFPSEVDRTETGAQVRQQTRRAKVQRGLRYVLHDTRCDGHLPISTPQTNLYS